MGRFPEDVQVQASTSATPSPERSLNPSPAPARPSALPSVSSAEAGPSSAPATTKTGAKKTQRPSWSCTECTRRKIKCDKLVPCGACTKRGKASSCRLAAPDPQLPLDPSTSANTRRDGLRLASGPEFDAIRQSVSQLRQRLYHLETVVGQFVPYDDAVGPDGGPMYAYTTNGNGVASSTTSGGASGSATGRFLKLEDEGDGEALSRRNSTNEMLMFTPSVERIREEGTVGESDGEVEAAVTLEFLALGRDRKQDHFSRSALRRPEEEDEASTSPSGPKWPMAPSALFPSAANALSMDPSHTISPYSVRDMLVDVLPDRQQSDAIVRYSLERVGWQHGAVHGVSFKAECDEFFSWGERRGQLVNQAWLALYYAILCVGTKHMSPQDRLDCGLLSEDAASLPKTFFDASVDALHRGNFLAKHSIYSVQAIVILVVTCQDVGGSDLIATLLACGVRIAQHLNIHRFSSDAEWETRRRKSGVDPYSLEGIKGLIDREVRKRLWYALTAEDWVSIPYRRSYAIFPSHFSTPLPTNCHDEDLATGNLVSRPLEEPTVATKLIISIRVASCIRRFFEDVNSLGGLSYDLCLQIDREIREIIRACPSYLHADTDLTHMPQFVASFRDYWIMSVSHKLLVIHRTFLGRSFRDPRFSYSRKAAIEAARGIIQRFLMGSRLPQHVWTAIYHAISASTILILDVFQSSSSDPSDDIANKRHEVTAALEELRRLEHSSPIAARGAQLLGTLLAEEAKHRRPGSGVPHESGGTQQGGSGGRKRKLVEGVDVGRFGDVAKRAASTVSSGSSSTSPIVATGSGGGMLSNGQFVNGLSPTAASPPTPFGAPSGGPFYAQQHDSPAGNSDGSLTQESYDALLWNGLGAHIGASPNAMMMDGTNGIDFWRMLDASFEPGNLAGNIDVGAGDMVAVSSGTEMSPFPSWQ
ncbi:hypothetical protein T439DRAFT_323651 [Meredithblackwellia eburnea MCA 4105]